jgi:hypothetical protein
VQARGVTGFEGNYSSLLPQGMLLQVPQSWALPEYQNSWVFDWRFVSWLDSSSTLKCWYYGQLTTMHAKAFAKGIVPDCEVHTKLHPALIIISRRLSELGLAAGSKYTWVPSEKHICVPVVGIVQHKFWTPLGKMVYIIGFKKPKASHKRILPVVAPHWNFPISSRKQGCIYTCTYCLDVNVC